MSIISKKSSSADIIFDYDCYTLPRISCIMTVLFYQKLLGVIGVDILVKDLEKHAPPHKVSPVIATRGANRRGTYLSSVILKGIFCNTRIGLSSVLQRTGTFYINRINCTGRLTLSLCAAKGLIRKSRAIN